ncbi:MAG: hypothetical protein WDN27_03645 [Candidatus Saccharibacteria bacterium]
MIIQDEVARATANVNAIEVAILNIIIRDSYRRAWRGASTGQKYLGIGTAASRSDLVSEVVVVNHNICHGALNIQLRSERAVLDGDVYWLRH